MIVLYIQCTDYSISFISFYINCFWQSRISRSDRRGTGRRTPRISCLPCQRRTTQSICAGKISPQTSSPNYFKHTDSIFFIVSRLPKMPTRIQCAFSFFLSISVDMLSIYFTCIYLLSDTWMVPLTGLLDPAVLVSGTGWGGGEKEDVHGLLPGTHEPIEFPKKYMQIWYVKPLHLELKRKTKPFKFKYCLLDIKF